MTPSMIDVIVGAGGTVGASDSLLGLVTEGKPKALLEIAGKTMVQWVLDAIAATDRVDNVIIIGLDPQHSVSCGKKAIHYIPSSGGIFENVVAGATKIIKINPDSKLTMWVSADIPLLTAEMLNWFLDKIGETDHDFYYQVINKSVMEDRFHGSRRTYTRLKGKTVCGGDVSAFSTAIASDAHPVWGKIASARKSVARQAALVGLWPLILLLTGQLTDQQAASLVHKRLGVDAVLLDCPYAEVGMDVDKPAQYEVARRELEGPNVK